MYHLICSCCDCITVKVTFELQTETMPPRNNNTVDELIKAQQHEYVHKAITALFDNLFDQMLSRMDELLKENTHLQQCIDKAITKLDELKVYNRKSNIVISVWPSYHTSMLPPSKVVSMVSRPHHRSQQRTLSSTRSKPDLE